MDTLLFILKITLVSLAITIGIKFLMPLFPIASTDTNALIAVTLPTLVMALVLWVQRSQAID